MWTINELENKIKESKEKMTIVFAEGIQEKIVENAKRVVENDLANVILLFNSKNEIPKNLDSRIQTIAIEDYDKTKMLETILEVRKGKLEESDAKKLIVQRNYFGVMMMKLNLADAMVCGLEYTTADTLRPALQIIKTNPNYSLASSVFLMSKDKESFVFTDCAFNVDPTSEQLADIAYMGATFAKDLNAKDVQVALLSYSSVGSGSGPSVDKVKNAVKLLSEKKIEDITFDGEMQFDTAFDKAVREKKYSNSKITKNTPDVFVFPDLNAGNIGYKIAQRLGGFQAAGPFVLGLNKPVNDLSRGANLEDIYQTSIVTIYSALKSGGKR